MAHIQLEPASKEIEKCIQDCLDCYDVCIQTEAHCLKMGGKHSEATHIQLLADCARICQVSAEFMLRGSPAAKALCRMCADLCARCAEDCKRFKDDKQMQKCAEVCSACAESCRQMA